MEALGLIKSIMPTTDGHTALVQMSLSFSPVKLALLIGWVYFCLYLVQRVEFSPLVPKNRKSAANVLTLLTGPVLLVILVLADAVKRSSGSGESVFAIIAAHFRNAIRRTSFSRLGRSRGQPKITLVDSSGRGIKEIYGHGSASKDDRHILDLTEQLIYDALEERASDILIDPKAPSVHTVRFRVDGVLRSVMDLEAQVGQAVVNSIKAVSGMDISERRRPQDGAFTARMAAAGSAAFRAASAGVVNGEKLSIRVLNQEAGSCTLTSVGMSQKQRVVIEEALRKPAGTVLMCGPTGSGKTTTIYAMLNEIDLFTRNVITVEDPIECVLPNCSQIEVNPRAGITFAKSLRSILRQDPDIICVGEIRDEETAAIALRASQTGHLVLATLHCETNASALVRLLDLGASPLLMASGLGVIACQRLVRRLCEECKVPAGFTQSQILEFRRKNINYTNMFQPQGCDACNGTGYYGRTGIFDILVLDEKLKKHIANGELTADALKSEGDKRGRSNLYKQGLRLVVSGVTSLEELKRVLG